MSTTSAYSSNKLSQVIKNETPHFITKSFVKPRFDYDRHKTEYHIYWYNSKNPMFKDSPRYKYLSYKIMNKREKKYFEDILEQYTEVANNKYGKVWENKKLGFDKTLVKNNQIRLDI
jgi:hypothetical protein